MRSLSAHTAHTEAHYNPQLPPFYNTFYNTFYKLYKTHSTHNTRIICTVSTHICTVHTILESYNKVHIIVALYVLYM